MKRIALAIEDNNGLESSISSHFGRCREYLLIDVEEGQVVAESVVANPFFGQHGACSVPGFIREQEAHVMIAGGMGMKALNLFEQYGIEVITGASGKAGDALNAYLAGTLKGFVACKEHGHGDHHH